MADHVSFAQAKKISPAFAGFLVDFSLGSREITATLLDLIARDILGVSGHTLFISKGLRKAKDFEREIVQLALQGKPSASFADVEKRLYKTHFDEVLRAIIKGAQDEGLVLRDLDQQITKRHKAQLRKFQDSMVKFSGKSMEQIVAEQKKNRPKPYYQSDPVVVRTSVARILLGILVVMTIFLEIINDDFSPAVNGILRMFSLVLWFTLVSTGLVMAIGLAYFKQGWDWILTKNGKEARKTAKELEAYMKTYPHVEDRIANELVGHSVAFGIGKQWMRKVGGTTAGINNFFEDLDAQGDTIMKVVDMKQYIKELYPTLE